MNIKVTQLCLLWPTASRVQARRDIVMVTTGSSARMSLNKTNIPVDMVVVAIIDQVI